MGPAETIHGGAELNRPGGVARVAALDADESTVEAELSVLKSQEKNVPWTVRGDFCQSGGAVLFQSTMLRDLTCSVLGKRHGDGGGKREQRMPTFLVGFLKIAYSKKEERRMLFAAFSSGVLCCLVPSC